MKKIGFLFLIKDRFFNKKFYKNYFKNINKDKFRVYVHYKVKPFLDFPNLTFVKSIPTAWGDISLVKATMILLEYAYKDGCDMFYILSSDSLPLKNFHDIYENDKTIFSEQSIKYGRKHVINNFMKLKMRHPLCKKFNLNSWRKQNMFFCMSRTDYEKINFKKYISLFSNLGIPDEYFFINIFIAERVPYVKGKYMFVDEREVKTSSRYLTSTDFIRYNSIMSKYMFCRKAILTCCNLT